MKDEIANLKRSHILEVAGRHFTETGYDATQISAIAKEAEVSIGTIYGFFENKEGLFSEFINAEMERIFRELQEELATISEPIEKLRAMARKKFEYMTRRTNNIREMLNKNPMFLVQASVAKNCPMEHIYILIASVLEELNQTVPLKNNDFIQMAYNFKALGNGYIERWATDERYEFRDKADEVVDFFIDGIKR